MGRKRLKRELEEAQHLAYERLSSAEAWEQEAITADAECDRLRGVIEQIAIGRSEEETPTFAPDDVAKAWDPEFLHDLRTLCGKYGAGGVRKALDAGLGEWPPPLVATCEDRHEHDPHTWIHSPGPGVRSIVCRCEGWREPADRST